MDKVYELFDPQSRSWDVGKVKSSFKPNIVVDILKIIILPTEQLDKYIWIERKWVVSKVPTS